METTKKTHLPLFGIKKLFPYLRSYRGLLFWMVLMGLYGSAMDAVIPLFQRYAINRFIADGVLDGIGLFVVLYLLVIVSQVISNYISEFGACRLEMYMDRDLRRAAFNHNLGL